MKRAKKYRAERTTAARSGAVALTEGLGDGTTDEFDGTAGIDKRFYFTVTCPSLMQWCAKRYVIIKNGSMILAGE